MPCLQGRTQAEKRHNSHTEQKIASTPCRLKTIACCTEWIHGTGNTVSSAGYSPGRISRVSHRQRGSVVVIPLQVGMGAWQLPLVEHPCRYSPGVLSRGTTETCTTGVQQRPTKPLQQSGRRDIVQRPQSHRKFPVHKTESKHVSICMLFSFAYTRANQ